MNGSDSRPGSPTEKAPRPRSLSTNPKAPPFPIRATKNPSMTRRRTPQNGGSPTLPYVDEDKLSNGGGQFSDRRSPEGMMRSTSPAPGSGRRSRFFFTS